MKTQLWSSFYGWKGSYILIKFALNPKVLEGPLYMSDNLTISVNTF